MRKILVIRYGTIGDSIFASAFYRELRNSLNDAQIDILADPAVKGVMQNCPYINNIIDIDGKYKNFFKYIMLFKKYDSIYFLKNDRFFTKIALLAGVKNRIGFDVKRNIGLNIKVPYNENRHEIDCYLDLLRETNIPVNNSKTEIWTDEKCEKKIKHYLSDKPVKRVLIQAYSRFLPKNWIDSYWVMVIKFLSEKAGVQVFFAGGAKDSENYQNLLKKLSDINIKPIDTSGQFTILETMELVKKMDLVIGVDSGIMHIAAAVNKPSLLLHGSTSLVRWKPQNPNCTILTKNYPCSPCCLQSGSKKLCKNQVPKCMKALTPDIVINKLKELLFLEQNNSLELLEYGIPRR